MKIQEPQLQQPLNHSVCPLINLNLKKGQNVSLVGRMLQHGCSGEEATKLIQIKTKTKAKF